MSTFCPNCGSLIVEQGGPADPIIEGTSSRRRLTWIGVVILAVGLIVALTRFGGDDDPVNAEPAVAVDEAPARTTAPPEDPVDIGLLAVGDCLEYPEGDIFYEFVPVDCGQPHDLEVFAILDLIERSDVAAAWAEFPGSDEIYDVGFDVCVEDFDAYVGTTYADSAIYVEVFTPTDVGWTTHDDHEVNCLLYTVNDDFEPVKTTGSLHNAGI